MDTKCPICEGVGWLREDKEVFEDGFGKLVPCICNKDAIEVPEPLPVPSPGMNPALLRWQDYTD